MNNINNIKTRVLVVDDEPMNLRIIEDYLEDLPDVDAIETAESGEDAWSQLQQSPDAFDVVLMDRMMPGVDGIEVLQRMKQHPILNRVPVIMQTAKAANSDILDGIKAGAHYYLTKPFKEEMLLSIVRTALRDRLNYRELAAKLDSQKNIFNLMDNGTFHVRTLNECRELAVSLSGVAKKPDAVVAGLSELMINAVEHGNLLIGYNEKTKLNNAGEWEAEVERRLALPENKHKRALVEFERTADAVVITISDKGDGFDWEKYLDFDASRAQDNHGRGIAMARMLSFENMEYLSNGTKVRLVMNTN